MAPNKYIFLCLLRVQVALNRWFYYTHAPYTSMVRSGGKPYRTDAQKHGGGRTRRQQLGDKLRENRRYLRENNLVELKTHSKPTTMVQHTDAQSLGVYGIYKDSSAPVAQRWVLTALSVTDEKETLNHHRGGGYSSTDVRGRWVLMPTHGEINPMQGMEMERFNSKSAAMNKVSADGSNRVENGYVIRAEHNPRRFHTERFDKTAFADFKRLARRIYE